MATISSLLADHVTLGVRAVDRLFLQGYVPRLMTEGQVIRFLLDRGFPIPSPAVLGKIGRDYVNRVNEFIVDHEIPTVRFVKGDVKEEIAREHFKCAEREGRFGVVMVGICQERTSAWRGWRDGGPDGHPHFVYRRQSIFPNNYYFYFRVCMGIGRNREGSCFGLARPRGGGEAVQVPALACGGMRTPDFVFQTPLSVAPSGARWRRLRVEAQHAGGQHAVATPIAMKSRVTALAAPVATSA